MKDELPEGWTTTTLKKLTRFVTSGSRGWAQYYSDNGALFLRVGNLDRYTIKLDLSDVQHVAPPAGAEGARTRVLPGDILVSITADVGMVGIVPDDFTSEAYVNQHVALCRPIDTRMSRFIGYALNDPQGLQRTVSGLQYGQTKPGLHLGQVRELGLAMPPLPEQHRIVEKVEALLEQVNRAKARLERVPLILKRFRQAVLAAACSGELTREWRESHPTVQPARDLLAAISARRTTLKLPTASRQIPDEGIEIPESELPDSWRWCRVGQIADVRLGGTPARKEPSYWNGSIPWVSSGEVANCRISGTAEQITKKGLENSNAKLYPAGSVLIAMIGEGKTRGQSAILDIDACTNQNVAGLIFDAGLVNPEYIWYWALQEYTKNREEGRGGNQAALNGAKVRALPLPLPPVNEQAEIVRVLKNMLRLASAIDARVNVATARANKLPQAILSKAFAGELVPTEAELARLEGRTYETAEELLKRVTALGSDAPSARKGRGRRTG